MGYSLLYSGHLVEESCSFQMLLLCSKFYLLLSNIISAKTVLQPLRNSMYLIVSLLGNCFLSCLPPLAKQFMFVSYLLWYSYILHSYMIWLCIQWKRYFYIYVSIIMCEYSKFEFCCWQVRTCRRSKENLWKDAFIYI